MHLTWKYSYVQDIPREVWHKSSAQSRNFVFHLSLISIRPRWKRTILYIKRLLNWPTQLLAILKCLASISTVKSSSSSLLYFSILCSIARSFSGAKIQFRKVQGLWQRTRAIIYRIGETSHEIINCNENVFFNGIFIPIFQRLLPELGIGKVYKYVEPSLFEYR